MGNAIEPDTDVSWIRNLHEVGTPLLHRIEAIDRERARIDGLRREIEALEAAVIADIGELLNRVDENFDRDEIVAAGGPQRSPIAAHQEPAPTS